MEVMGVGAEAARAALAESSNNVNEAVSYLLARPELAAAGAAEAEAGAAEDHLPAAPTLVSREAARARDGTLLTPRPTHQRRQESADLRRLVDMGFSAELSARALARSDNDVERALVWLLDNPAEATPTVGRDAAPHPDVPPGRAGGAAGASTTATHQRHLILRSTSAAANLTSDAVSAGVRLAVLSAAARARAVAAAVFPARPPPTTAGNEEDAGAEVEADDAALVCGICLCEFEEDELVAVRGGGGGLWPRASVVLPTLIPSRVLGHVFQE